MRTLWSPFCEVCTETLVLSLYDWLSAIDSFSPANTDVSITGESVTLSVTPLTPKTHALDIQWFVNQTPVAGATSAMFVLSPESLPSGTYEVTAMLHDTTPLVRNDPANLLSDSHTWNITITEHDPSAPIPPRLKAGHDGHGEFLITITGSIGSHYVIQVTTDFLTWDTLAIVTNTTGTIHLTDPAARLSQARFYRAVAQ